MNELPANIGKLFFLLIILLIFFDVLFIRILKLGKIAWKRTDYVWLGVATLSLVTLSFQARSWLAENKAELAKYRAETRYSMFRDYAGPSEPPSYVCRTFIKTQYSPENLEEIQKEYDQICEWNIQLLQNISQTLDGNIPEIKFVDLQPTMAPKSASLLEYLDTLKMYLEDYGEYRREYFSLKEKAKRNGLEQLLLYISPILICIALALRITKVTGEITFEKVNKSNAPNMSFRKSNQRLPYIDPGRLADVMALIQVLSLDKHAHRSEEGLQQELQGTPNSSDTWTNIAKEHQEFFRVLKNGTHTVSLVARHVLPRTSEGTKELPSDFVDKLLQAAIEIHDRQLDRAHHWKTYIPIIVAITAGLFTIFGVFLKSWLAP